VAKYSDLIMLDIGDIVRVKKEALAMCPGRLKSPEGAIFWISPSGIHRILIEGCGWQFKPEDVELLSIEVDISEFEES